MWVWQQGERSGELPTHKLCTLHEIVQINQILQIADHTYEYNSITHIKAAIQHHTGLTVLVT